MKQVDSEIEGFSEKAKFNDTEGEMKVEHARVVERLVKDQCACSGTKVLGKRDDFSGCAEVSCAALYNWICLSGSFHVCARRG